MVYVWGIMMLPFKTPKWLVLIVSFVLGFIIDIFSPSVGINAAVCVITGFLRPIILNMVIDNIDNTQYYRPTQLSLGFKKFFMYAAVTVVIHTALYFMLEVMSFKDVFQTLLRILLSSAVTLLIILLSDTVFFRR